MGHNAKPNDLSRGFAVTIDNLSGKTFQNLTSAEMIIIRQLKEVRLSAQLKHFKRIRFLTNRVNFTCSRKIMFLQGDVDNILRYSATFGQCYVTFCFIVKMMLRTRASIVFVPPLYQTTPFVSFQN